MSLLSREFVGGAFVRPIPPIARRVLLRAGGAAALQADYLALAHLYERVGILNVKVSGVLAGSAHAVLEARLAPFELAGTDGSYRSSGSEDSEKSIAGKAWDRLCDFYAGGSGVVNGVDIGSKGALLVTRAQHSDLDIPQLRFRDADAVFATGAFTLTGVPAAGGTVTVFGVVGTWRAALTSPAVADEILLGADAAACCENMRRWVNGGLGAGRNYSSSTVPKDETKGYAVDNAHASVVTISALLAGTDGNALTIAEASTNLTVSGATLASGADGSLGSATTDFLEALVTYVVVK